MFSGVSRSTVATNNSNTFGHFYATALVLVLVGMFFH